MKNDPDLNLKPTAALEAGAGRQVPPGVAGCELIYQERVRQIEAKRRTLEHDRRVNTKGELAHAGACYALLAGGLTRAATIPGGTPDVVALAPLKQWPWTGAAWKPSNSRLKNLVRAGALIAAEIDRVLSEGERLPVETPEPTAEQPETGDRGQGTDTGGRTPEA